MQPELFDKTVLPVMLYGCKVWGYENILLKVSEIYIEIKDIYPKLYVIW